MEKFPKPKNGDTFTTRELKEIFTQWEKQKEIAGVSTVGDHEGEYVVPVGAKLDFSESNIGKLPNGPVKKRVLSLVAPETAA